MPNIRCVSLGCPKNLVDTEVMLGNLARAGYRIIDSDDTKSKSDIFLINTCCFIKEAEAESRDVIRQAIAWRRDNRKGKVVVSGCLAQRYADRLKDDFKGDVDAVVSVRDRDSIVQVCDRLTKIHHKDTKNTKNELMPNECRKDVGRLRITPAHYAYLRIAEGCNNRCSYCIIPSLHGPYRSKPLKDIINEAKELAAGGVVELNLIAQDTTSYGSDVKSVSLPDVLARLSAVKGIKWIRLLYTHPAHFSDGLIDAISRLDKVVKYVDLPIQHISDAVLKRMGRKVTEAETRRLIGKLRSRVRGLFLRTSLIVGFPGETEADFDRLVSFTKDIGFERLGAFTYSPEKGTPAQRMAHQVPESVKQSRLDKVMVVQQKIAFGQNSLLVGKKIPVIIDVIDNGIYTGRTYGDAPEVDGTVLIRSKRRLVAGHIGPALITGTKGYDLVGDMNHEGTK